MSSSSRWDGSSSGVSWRSETIAFHLTPAIFIRAGGGLLYALLGLALVARARGRAAALSLGIAIGGLGAAILCANLALAGAPADVLYLGASLVTGSGLAAAWSYFVVPAPLAPGERRRILPVAVAAVVLGATLLVYRLTTTTAPGIWADLAQGAGASKVRAYRDAFVAIAPLILGAPVAFGLRFANARDPVHDRLLMGVSSGLSIFVGFASGADSVSGQRATVFEGLAFPSFPFLAVIAAAWLWAAHVRGDRRAVHVALLPLVAAFIGMAQVAATGIASFEDPYSTVGLARIVGWTVIAYTCVKTGLLDVHFASRTRSATGAVALAALFIVAQVAQNFFAAQYGLLLGGAVAGAFLFAAAPLQRALDHIRQPGGERGSSSEKNRRVYREALRHALRDGAIDRQEELRLAELAEALSIPNAEALRLQYEVQDEGTAPATRPGRLRG